MLEKVKDELARQRIADLLTTCQGTHGRLNGTLDRLWTTVGETKDEIAKQGKEMSDEIAKLRVEMGRQVPPWVLVVFTVGGSTITGLGVYLLTH